MSGKNPIVKRKALAVSIYLMIALSVTLFSFKPLRSATSNTGKATGRNFSYDLLRSIKDLINEGEGYDFANANEERLPYTYIHENLAVANNGSPVSKYDFYPTAQVALPVPDNSPAEAVSPTGYDTESSALSQLSLYVPADMLESVSEAQAKELIDKAASLPPAMVERVRNNPQLLSKLRTMDVTSILNYKLN